MFRLKRILLIAPAEMTRTPAFDRAQALARVSGALLHIVAFDYLEGLATAGMVNEQALEQMRLGYVERHRQWLEDQHSDQCKQQRKKSAKVAKAQTPEQHHGQHQAGPLHWHPTTRQPAVGQRCGHGQAAGPG